MSSYKRPRGQQETSRSPTSSPTDAHPSKSIRTAPRTPATHPLLCTLPPTCNPPSNRPTPLANSLELESHYAKYHAHVCEWERCGCVFPEERLLTLHQTECHDPLAAVRKERGEKIFACHVSNCTRLFLIPKARRLHLIQAHGFPKEYFFAVTNKGVGGLLKKWGEGASMLRGEWKAREARDAIMDQDDDEGDEGAEGAEDTDEIGADLDPRGCPNAGMTNTNTEPSNSITSSLTAQVQGNDISTLTDSLHTLALVPPSIRFGRGGKNGGFAHLDHDRFATTQDGKRGGRSGGPRGGRGQAGPGARHARNGSVSETSSGDVTVVADGSSHQPSPQAGGGDGPASQRRGRGAMLGLKLGRGRGRGRGRNVLPPGVRMA